MAGLSNNEYMQRLTTAQAGLYHFVASMMPFSPDAVEDVVQNANAALIRRAAEYDVSRPFMSWVFAFARVEVRDFRKRQSRSRLAFGDDALELGVLLAAEDAMFADDGKTSLLLRLSVCRSKLPARHRDLLEMFYDNRMSAEEIGRKLGKTPHNVASTLAYIRGKLAECMRSLCMVSDAELERREPDAFRDALADAVAALLPEAKREELLQKAAVDRSRMRLLMDQFGIDGLLRKFPAPASVRDNSGRRRWAASVVFGTLAAVAGVIAFTRQTAEEKPEEEEILRLRYERGLSVREVAEKTGSNSNAVKVALCSMRKKLADCVRKLRCPVGESEVSAQNAPDVFDEEFFAKSVRKEFFARTAGAALEEYLEQARIHCLLGGYAAQRRAKRVPRWAKIAAVSCAGIAASSVFFAKSGENVLPEAAGTVVSQTAEVQWKETEMRIGSTAGSIVAATAILASAVSAEEPDCYVDYVEANGSQYVILEGITGKSGTRVEAVMQWNRQDSSLDECFLGSKNGDTRYFLLHSAYGKLSYGYNNFVYATQDGDNIYIPSREKHTVVSELKAGSQTIAIDGKTVWTAENSTEIDTGKNLYLFGINIGDKPYNLSHARVWSLKVWQGDELVGDFRPCVKNKKGALYDNVSGNILYSSNSEAPLIPGMDAIVAEPDAFVDSVKSPGDGWIDTGIFAKSGLSAEGDIGWDAENVNWDEKDQQNIRNGEQTFLGAIGNGQRFYMLHRGYDGLWYGYGTATGYPRDSSGEKIDFLFPDQKNHFRVDYLAGAQSIVLNNQTLWQDTLAEVDTGYTLFAFACHHTGRNIVFQTPARCWGFKLWENGTLARDFRPCLYNGEGCLYDAVEGKIYRSWQPLEVQAILPSATDKPIRWLDGVGAKGKQWFDTGVIGRSGTKMEAVVEWTRQMFGLDQEFLGARSGDMRFLLFHSANAELGLGYGEWRYAKHYGGATGLETGRKYTIVSDFRNGSQTITADGQTVYSAAVEQDIDTGLPLYGFGVNYDGTPSFLCYANLYSLKIWQDGTLVRNFRACTTTAGVPMLWDSVTRKLYASNGKLPFVAVGEPGERVSNGTVVMLLGN